MHNARLRLMAGLAGATLCLFAVTSYGQNPTTTTPDASAQTTPAQPTTPAPGTETQVTTTSETTTWSFPGGIWGILAVAVLVLFILFALFRGRDTTTVVKETSYVPPSTGPSARTGTAVGDRNLNPRAASGTEPPRSGGVNDPNSRL